MTGPVDLLGRFKTIWFGATPTFKISPWKKNNPLNWKRKIYIEGKFPSLPVLKLSP